MPAHAPPSWVCSRLAFPELGLSQLGCLSRRACHGTTPAAQRPVSTKSSRAEGRPSQELVETPEGHSSTTGTWKHEYQAPVWDQGHPPSRLPSSSEHARSLELHSLNLELSPHSSFTTLQALPMCHLLRESLLDNPASPHLLP